MSEGRQRLWIFGVPVAARLLVLAAAGFLVFPLLHHVLRGPGPIGAGGGSLALLAATLLVALAIVAFWEQRRQARIASRAEYEAVLNHRAIEWLRHGDFDRLKLEAEVPRETVYLPGWRARWLLVTNRRVLLFVASRRGRRLRSEWPRRSVVAAGTPRAGSLSPWMRLLRPAPNLELTFTTGTTLHLRCASTVTARRVAQLLMSSPALPDESIQVPAHFSVARRAR